MINSGHAVQESRSGTAAEWGGRSDGGIQEEGMLTLCQSHTWPAPYNLSDPLCCLCVMNAQAWLNPTLLGCRAFTGIDNVGVGITVVFRWPILFLCTPSAILLSKNLPPLNFHPTSVSVAPKWSTPSPHGTPWGRLTPDPRLGTGGKLLRQLHGGDSILFYRVTLTSNF